VQVILHLRPRVEGLLTIIGLGFELQANSVESPATGKIPSIHGKLVQAYHITVQNISENH